MIWRRAATAALVAGIFLPPIYLFAMIEYGAITFPYWDHLASAKQIVEYFDGTLTFPGFVGPVGTRGRWVEE
jgi:hypothetical protein